MITAINDYLVIKQQKILRQGSIHLPDESMMRILCGAAITCGPKVHPYIQQGSVVLASWTSSTTRYNGSVIIRDSDLMMVLVGAKWFPLGDVSLLKREVEESTTSGGIVIPSCYQSKDQTLDCIFITSGISRNLDKSNTEVEPGDQVRIERWDHSIKEVEISGGFYVICPNRLILYKKTK